MRFRTMVLAAVCAFTASPLAAQQEAEQEVLQVVVKLFDGMRARDTTLMRAAFLPEARMFGFARDGSVTAESPDGWIRSIGSAPPGPPIDEVLHEPEVRIDGSIATVWTYYDLFVGDRFIHCGYDAFQLLKTSAGWKVASVLDTRRQDGCRKQRK